MSQMPNSRTPGVSATQPSATRCKVAKVVVWRPFWVLSLISLVRRSRPGWTALSRLDFPTPEGPETTLVWCASASRRASRPSPVSALVSSTG